MGTLKVSNIDAVYASSKANEKVVLHNISFEIGEGEFFVVVGPSGSGKTTLLNLVAGFQFPAKGRIELDGVEVNGPSAERGVVFQQDALLPWLTVIQNVAFGLQLKGVDKQTREFTAKNILNLVGLKGFEAHHIWELSGGMKQRVNLARAIVVDPQLLLMDEPFGALDAFTKEQMQVLVLKVWHETGKQILLITHDIEEAIFMATKLLLLTSSPGKVAQILHLDFGKRLIAGENVRQIKADPQFIEIREKVLEHFFSEQVI
ncbi:MAG: taurine ABC transporter ATP-binding subunit [Methylotenera sp.]|nr:taurine ABC transporter ATP-binding subunit [Methylotenera sp.]